MIPWDFFFHRYLLVSNRSLAISLDQRLGGSDASSENHVTRLVDSLRQSFGNLLRERDKKAGVLLTVTEIVRLNLRMFQMTAAVHLLKNIERGEG